MKQLLFYTAFFAFIVLLCPFGVLAQDSSKNKPSTIEQKITNKDFTFVANWANPMSSATRQLTSYYNLTVNKDSLIVDLPYFGRSYTAPLDPTNIGININAVGFEYSFVKKKKDRWDITIVPKDRTDVQSFSMTVYDDGTAYLNVTCSNRNPISYNGRLEEKK
jgi:hypothetical protein